jgi:hypothetical protein
MQITRSALLAGLTFIQSVVFGFTDTLRVDTLRPKPIYFNQFVAGGLFGQTAAGMSASLGMSHGIRYRKCALAIGVSFDDYGQWRTFPVFGSFSFDLGASQNTGLFLQLNAGTTKVWHVDSPNDYQNYNENGGKMIQPSLGYRVQADKWSIYFVAGYRFQQIKYTETPRWWVSGWGPLPYKYTVERNMDRLVLQIGIGLR